MVTVWPWSEIALADVAPHCQRDTTGLPPIFFAREVIKCILELQQAGFNLNEFNLMSFQVHFSPPPSPNSAVSKDETFNSWTSHWQKDGSGGWARRGLSLRTLESAQLLPTPSSKPLNAKKHAMDILKYLFSPSAYSQLQIEQRADDLRGLMEVLEGVLMAPDPGKYRTSLKTLLTRLHVTILSNTSATQE